MTFFEIVVVCGVGMLVIQTYRCADLLRNVQADTAQMRKAEDQKRNMREQQDRTRWEYKHIEFVWNKEETRFRYWANGDIDETLTSRMECRHDARNFVNIVGREGWELVAIDRLQSESKDERGFSYWFKRALIDPC